jgi:hypothetical protein
MIMGSGLGSRQRGVLATLARLDQGGERSWHALTEVTAGMTRPQFESARQSVAALQRRRLISLRHQLVGVRAQVFIRLTKKGGEELAKLQARPS